MMRRSGVVVIMRRFPSLTTGSCPALTPPRRLGTVAVMSTPDPVTLAVLDNRFRAIVEEMGEAMLRTTYSQILNSSRDFSIGSAMPRRG